MERRRRISCSAYDAKPSWQTDAGCSKRTVADVAAVADPNTGVAVRQLQLPGSVWLARVRRHQRGGTGHRLGVRHGRRRCNRRLRHLPLLSAKLAQRRDLGQQRLMWRQLPVHRRPRLRRPDRPGDAQQHGWLLVRVPGWRWRARPGADRSSGGTPRTCRRSAPAGRGHPGDHQAGPARPVGRSATSRRSLVSCSPGRWGCGSCPRGSTPPPPAAGCSSTCSPRSPSSSTT